MSTIPDEKEETGPEYSKMVQEQKDQADRDGTHTLSRGHFSEVTGGCVCRRSPA